MIPPWSSASEWENPPVVVKRQISLTLVAEEMRGQFVMKMGDAQSYERSCQAGGRDQSIASWRLVLQGNGHYRTVGMEQVLQEKERGGLEDVGSINQRAGVREEKWSTLDLKQLNFPQSTVSSLASRNAAVLKSRKRCDLQSQTKKKAAIFFD